MKKIVCFLSFLCGVLFCVPTIASTQTICNNMNGTIICNTLGNNGINLEKALLLKMLIEQTQEKDRIQQITNRFYKIEQDYIQNVKIAYGLKDEKKLCNAWTPCGIWQALKSRFRANILGNTDVSDARYAISKAHMEPLLKSFLRQWSGREPIKEELPTNLNRPVRVMAYFRLMHEVFFPQQTNTNKKEYTKEEIESLAKKYGY